MSEIDKITDVWHGHTKAEVRSIIQQSIAALDTMYRKLKDSYQKPEGGIPKSDLSDEVRTVLGDAVLRDPETGRMSWGDLPCMVLASMGAQTDGSSYSPVAGDLVYNEARQELRYIYPSGYERWPVAAGVIYYNMRTDRFYRWDEKTGKMVMVGKVESGGGSVDVSGKADLDSHVGMLAMGQWPRNILKSITPAVSNDTEGELYVMEKFKPSDPVQLGVTVAGTSYAVGSPSPYMVYLAKDTFTFYRWDEDNQEFVEATALGSDLSEASLKRNIMIVQENLARLRAALANSAFLSSRPVLTPLDWVTVETHRVRITPLLTGCVMVKPESFETDVVPGGSLEIVLNVKAGYSFTTTAPVIKEGNVNVNAAVTYQGNTMKIVITGIDHDMELTLSVTASETLHPSQEWTVRLVDGSGVLSLSESSAVDGTTYVAELSVSDATYRLPDRISVTDEQGNALEYTYVDGVITVEGVTCNVVITAEAVQLTCYVLSLPGSSGIKITDAAGVDVPSRTLPVWEGEDVRLYMQGVDGTTLVDVDVIMSDGTQSNAINPTLSHEMKIPGAWDSSSGLLYIPSGIITGDIEVSARTASMPKSNITLELTGCSGSAPSRVDYGTGFSVELIPDAGMSLNADGAVQVMMSGKDVTAECWSPKSSRVTIEHAAGNITITAVAVATTMHSVTYRLDKVTTDGASSVADGGRLVATLTAAADFDGIASRGDSLNRGFTKRDVLVLMDGVLLEDGVDCMLTQESVGGAVTVTIGRVTGDVTIMNVVWVTNYLTKAASFDRIATPRSVIPLPAGCAELEVVTNVSIDLTNDMPTQMYAGADVSQSYLPVKYKVMRIQVNAAEDGVRPTLYDWHVADYAAQTTNTKNKNGINSCYIYDVTHGRFIWKGDKVTGLVNENKETL